MARPTGLTVPRFGELALQMERLRLEKIGRYPYEQELRQAGDDLHIVAPAMTRFLAKVAGTYSRKEITAERFCEVALLLQRWRFKKDGSRLYFGWLWYATQKLELDEAEIQRFRDVVIDSAST